MTDTLSLALATWTGRQRDRLLADPLFLPVWQQRGRVTHIGDGIAQVSGLDGAAADAMLLLPGGVRGLVLDLDRDRLGCLLLGDGTAIKAGDPVSVAEDVLRVPVGDSLLGRVIDPLGRALDGRSPPVPDRFDPVERAAPSLTERGMVSQTMPTGTTIIDALYPIGRGQRELIVGDRATGKTSIAVDAMLAQSRTDIIPVYCAIGQRASAVADVISSLKTAGMMERAIIIVAAPDAAPGLQWIAPFAAMTMAEFFRDAGQHVLLVLDDLSKHAAMHRQISLLLQRPPGREAFPGDIFHLHARLLERSAKLSAAAGGGSLTCLPVVETQAGNLSAYIPTNLISITDGQIVLDARQFQSGQRPAIDVGRSVSRVGARTQHKMLRQLAEQLKLEYAQFLELEAFTRFGGLVDERTRHTVDRGRRLRRLLAQRHGRPRTLGAEVALLLAHEENLMDGLDLAVVERVRDAIVAGVNGTDPTDLHSLRQIIADARERAT
ncbi:F0F1 ATP synthase subunit alpha [Niveispirillum lacus]|uniref:ATP synthase subunit alpha n=1 Tax=Niveispirillum lacus TaxID=1981099 RepID=A0A255Z5G9_9PROT|nr:F0F1 ATP synthase subunit alpha [Niveispirillum lacus]OYQ36672.1 F0F1 ATP synthase subunit alpha [Niveispirillum lacus]